MDEKNLVFVVVDDAGKFRTAPNQITLGELALKYRVLQMIAVSAHGLEDLAETAVVGDVVANEIGLAHLSGPQRLPQIAWPLHKWYDSARFLRKHGLTVPWGRAVSRSDFATFPPCHDSRAV
jgi:hypothetical protein